MSFTIVKDGRKCKYLCYKGVEFIEYDLLFENDTDEENGVLFEMPILNYAEYESFKKKAKQKLAYYDTVVLMIDGSVWDNKIYRTETFQWCTESPYGSLHLCLKDVVYNIDFDKLGIQNVNLPIALRFGLKDKIVPSPSRETILMSRETIELIKERIQEVAAWFVERYNSEAKEYENIIEAWEKIGSTERMVELQGTSFNVNAIKEHTSVIPKGLLVKGMKLKEPYWYKNHIEDLLYEYTSNAYDDRRTWRTKNLWYDLKRNAIEGTVIVFNHTLSGNVKEYLRKKWGYGALYVSKEKKMALRAKYYGTTTYTGLLSLTKDNKALWREYIQEFQAVRDSITCRFIDETDVETTQEYQEWLEEKKTFQKENRKVGYTSSGKPALNKDRKTEITIGTARKKINSNEATFDRATRKIAELHRHKKLSVYLTEEQTSNRGWVWQMTKQFPKMDWVMLNPTEEKYVKSVHNYVTLKEFYMTRPFSRMFTAIMVGRLLERIPNDKGGYIREMFPKWNDLYDRLNHYHKQNHQETNRMPAVEQMIVDEGKLNSSWDASIMGDYREMQEIADMFYFLPLLQKDGYYDTPELKNDRKKLVASMLLFQKRNMQEYDLVPKVPVEVLESMHVDIDGELVESETV